MSFKVECTWGEGPDIILAVKENVVLLKPVTSLGKFVHGCCEHIQWDLTAEKARTLAADLVKAADDSDRLDAELNKYYIEQGEKAE